MLVLSLSGFLALILTYYASRDEIPFGFQMAFILVTFFAAIRCNYGNDYAGYEYIFYSITSNDFSWEAIWTGTFYKEPGWAFLCFAFKPLGFQWLIVFISAVQNAIAYYIIKNNVSKRWLVFALCIYLFCKDIYPLNMSMMRQGLAISLFVFAFFLTQNKKLWSFLLGFIIIWFASKIHSSAVVCYPFLLWHFMPIKNAKALSVFFMMIFLFFMIRDDAVNNIMHYLYDMEDFQEYSKNYAKSSGVQAGIGFALFSVPFFIALGYMFWNEKSDSQKNKLVAISCIGTLLTPFCLLNPTMYRLGYYFLPFNMIAYPIIYEWLRGWCRCVFLALYLFILFYSYIAFFLSDIWGKYFFTFHSIFEVIF